MYVHGIIAQSPLTLGPYRLSLKLWWINIIRAHRTTIEMFLKLIAKIFYLLKCWKFRFRQNFKFTLDSIKLNRFLWIITLRNVRMKDPCFKESKRPLLQVDLKILGGVNREAKI